jgi:toxin ParE1/3/4
LAEIAAYIAKDSEFYAAAVVRELVDAGRSLALFAERGRVVPEYQDAAIRELLVRDFRLVYEVGGGSVHVLRIIHGARRLPPPARPRR